MTEIVNRSSSLKLTFLGGYELMLDEDQLANFGSRKALALFFYLVVTAKPQSRDALAALLWPELAERSAKNNLRTILNALKSHLAPYLDADSSRIGFNRHLPYVLDVELFRARADAAISSQDRQKLQAAINLYQGEFLAGFHVRNAAPFEEWLLQEREQLHLLMVHALELLTGLCVERGDHNTGLAAGRRLLTLEPWLESAHRQIMILLTASGMRAQALQQYETCRQLLTDELAVEPSVETTVLFQQIQTGTDEWSIRANTTKSSAPLSSTVAVVAPAISHGAVTEEPVIPTNLPTPLTEFIGRQDELAFASQRLRSTNCRLLTVVGPGGIGKTTFAQALGLQLLGSQAADFADGIFWVSLVDSSASAMVDEAAAEDTILRAVANQLGHQLETNLSSPTELQAYLRTRSLLLILDNLEHLLAGSGAVVTLLTNAPRIKALVTSRSRLNVRGETLLTLDKLSLPMISSHDIVGTIHTNQTHFVSTGVWQQSEAVTMFVQRAQQVDPAFAINTETLRPVIEICQLVEGLPLGIELATSMLSLVSCQALAAELAQSLDFLAVETRDLPHDQRTLQAVFERSWRLLSPAEQRLLANLSIFPSSFGRAAAEQITGASINLLRRLIDQSLIYKVGDGRYTFHRTIHAFAQRKLEQWPEQIETLRTRYTHFYLDFLISQEKKLTGTATESSMEQILADLDNVYTAWRWAVTYHWYQEINLCLSALFLFFDQQSFYLDALALHQYSLSHLTARGAQEPEQATTSTERNMVLGRLYTHFGVYNYRLGRVDQAQTAYQSGWALLQRQDHRVAAAQCLGLWGFCIRGYEPQRALAMMTKAVQLVKGSGVTWMEALTKQVLGTTAILFGNYAVGEEQILAGYRLAKQMQWPRGMNSGHLALGRVNLMRGRYRQAEEHLRAGIAIARQHHLNNFHLEGMKTLVEALRLQYRLAEASACLVEIHKLAETLGSDSQCAALLWEEGCLAEQCNDYGKAKARFTESLAIGKTSWWGHHVLPTLGWALIGLGELDDAHAYFQTILTDAEAQGRLPIGLDAQAGLAYIAEMRAKAKRLSSRERIWPIASVFERIHQHPATTQVTRDRVAKLSTELGLLLNTATSKPHPSQVTALAI